MSNLIPLQGKTDVAEVLQEVLAEADKYDCIVVVGMLKDRTQVLRTSSCNMLEKSFLLAFFNAWMSRWFEIPQGQPPAS